jgi:MarR family transcriptional regulator for hemolysin
VTRHRQPNNRRVHQVQLTEAGDALFFQLLQRVVTFDKQLRTGFSEGDLAELRQLLDRIGDNTTARDASEDGGSAS